MRGLNFRPVLALIVALSLLGAARGAPLDLKHVSADAKWLGHVDFDALRASSVVNKAWQYIRQTHQDAEKHLDFVSGLLGMDLRKDLHGVTIYGKDLGTPTGVLIVHAKIDRKRLISIAEKGPDHQVTRHESYELHSWRFERGGHSQIVAAAYHKADRVVLASSIGELKQALGVLRGKLPSVRPDAPLSGRIPPGTTVLFRAVDVGRAHVAAKSPVAKQTESFRFVSGEDNGRSFFRARVVLKQDDLIPKLKAVVEGGRALASLHASGDKQAERLVDGLKVKVDGTTLTVLWSASADDVWTVMQKHAKALAERRAKREAWRSHRGVGHERPGKKSVPPEEDF